MIGIWTRSGFMNYEILVNRENRLPEDYLETVCFIEAQTTTNETCKVEISTYRHFCKLVSDFKKEGITIGINSAYRSVEEQQEVFDEFVQKDGLEIAKMYVAEPYHSEHHTGLAIDINIWTEEERKLAENPELKEEIEKKKIEEYNRIHQKLKDYGFILRYPKGKEEITGYKYEPWHIRYVSKLARKMEVGDTLEETLLKKVKRL